MSWWCNNSTRYICLITKIFQRKSVALTNWILFFFICISVYHSSCNNITHFGNKSGFIICVIITKPIIKIFYFFKITTRIIHICYKLIFTLYKFIPICFNFLLCIITVWIIICITCSAIINTCFNNK